MMHIAYTIPPPRIVEVEDNANSQGRVRIYYTSYLISESGMARSFFPPIDSDAAGTVAKSLGKVGEKLVNNILNQKTGIHGLAELTIEPYCLKIKRSLAVDWEHITPWVVEYLKECFGDCVSQVEFISVSIKEPGGN